MKEDIKFIFLALGIYGIVIFPAAIGLLDPALIKIFRTLMQKPVDLVPSMVAETLITKNHCREGRMTRALCFLAFTSTPHVLSQSF